MGEGLESESNVPHTNVHNRYASYLRWSVEFIGQYGGKIPLAEALKAAFARNRKMGSTDRRTISRLVYQYFRLGWLARHLPAEERLLMAEWICNPSPSPLLATLRPAWATQSCQNIAEKFEALQIPFDPSAWFPDIHLLSNCLSAEAWMMAHFLQPPLYLRVRPGKWEKVTALLAQAGMQTWVPEPLTISLPNGSPVNQVLALNRDAVIQDWSSQRVGIFLKKNLPGPLGAVWDCCAGSGGKSILLHDIYPNGITLLLVSDVRKSILKNLRLRFAEAGIAPYQTLVTDLAAEYPLLPQATFDCIVADVPCSGSGTWTRTPENLCFFSLEKLAHYSQLQSNIAQNVLNRLKPGGYLVYITCSVFAMENQIQVENVLKNQSMKRVAEEYLDGTTKQADTLYVALLQKQG